jgi:diguanylate cyclase (GGDEF)-like protein
VRHSAESEGPAGLPGGTSQAAARPKSERYDRVRGRVADAALSHLPLAVAVIDGSLRLAYWNAHAAALWGVPPLMAAEQPPLRDILAGIHGLGEGQAAHVLAFCREQIACGDRVAPESWLRLTCGRDRRLCIQVMGLGRGQWMLVLNDGRGGIAVEPGAQGGRDAWLDALTGLKNRRQLQAVLDEAIASPSRGEAALLLVDVIGLERINAAHGRAAADSLLCVMARRMERDLRDADILARFGGGTFAILASGGATGLSERLLTVLSRPYQVEGRLIEAAFAIGVAPLAAARSPAALLDQAMAALHTAKADAGGRGARSAHEAESEVGAW